MEILDSILSSANQQHIVSFLKSEDNVDASSETLRLALMKQLMDLDVGAAKQVFMRSMKYQAESLAKDDANQMVVEPVKSNAVVSEEDVQANRRLYLESGLDLLSKGSVAVVTLAGGQGSRLGFDGPKGKYDFGLKLGKTLFQLQAERISALEAQIRSRIDSISNFNGIPWYIMTSPLNHEETVNYFEDHHYFGLQKKNVTFFQQGVLPCFELNDLGRIIIKSRSEVATAPDGNGGVYSSLIKSGCFDDMTKRGVQYIHFLSVDNALVLPADPHFLGVVNEKSKHTEIQVANLACKKQGWNERVGVFALRNGKFSVIEYSEISEDLAKQEDESGELRLRSANICNHLLSVKFLKEKVLSKDGSINMPYHVAKKKIPYWDEKLRDTVKPESNNGIKLELFIFDVFQLCDDGKFLNVEMNRNTCFAPVKNAPGSPKDSPDTARALFRNMCSIWLSHVLQKRAPSNALVEVSPLCSLFGDGLECLTSVKVEWSTISTLIIVSPEEFTNCVPLMSTVPEVLSDRVKKGSIAEDSIVLCVSRQ